MSCADICICAPVSAAGLTGLLEASGQGAGAYRDTHPWLVAARLLQSIQERGESAALILALPDEQRLSHYGIIQTIDVVELHRGAFETRCRFNSLQLMHPVWSALDSLALAPGAEQLEREAIEGIRKFRTALSAKTLHPYALCETPEFLKVQ